MKRLALLICFALAACTSYEYEEDTYLEVDGSGRLRISGSAPLFRVMHGIEGVSPEALRRHFGSEAIAIDSIRRTERDHRSFFHVQLRFQNWNDVCQHPAFRDRRCELVFGEHDRALELVFPRPRGSPPASVDPDSLIAIRFHFPSTVHYHNAREGMERGNILSWRRTLSAHFQSPPLEVRARFDDRSVLDRTVHLLTMALGVVLASAATALILIVRKGRREISTTLRESPAREAEDGDY